MGALILKLALQYIESNPAVITQLLDEVVKAGIKALQAHNAPVLLAPRYGEGVLKSASTFLNVPPPASIACAGSVPMYGQTVGPVAPPYVSYTGPLNTMGAK